MSRQNRINNALTQIQRALSELADMDNSTILETKSMLLKSMDSLKGYQGKLAKKQIESNKELNQFNNQAKQYNAKFANSRSLQEINKMIAEQKHILDSLNKIDTEQNFDDENLNG